MTDKRLTPGEIRELLAEASIDIRDTRWPAPGFVICQGETLAPHPESGMILADGKPVFSAAWR